MALVLVVEDEEAMRRALRRFLEREGHGVSLAEDGEAALALVEQAGPFDVALVDLRMPGMGGYEFIRRARSLEHFSRTSVIVTSGAADVVPDDLRDVVVLVVDKPIVDFYRLLRTIDDCTRTTLPPDAPSSGA